MELEQFVDQLIAERGIDSEDPEVRAQVKADLMERVEDRIQALILANLPEDQLEAFDEKLSNGSDEDVQEYLQATIPDFDGKVANELLLFRATYTS
ncbi:MAG: hypothetical protein JWN49_153 [Parcubacteria group bacterium]|nr:hypothetical protein [Parcubacteria group bacterium]MDB5245063.1 hypothetical protein [Parcubacteria group bacterium]